jgi:hypothetical protein
VSREKRRRENRRALGWQGRRKDLRGRLHAAIAFCSQRTLLQLHDAAISDFFSNISNSSEEKEERSNVPDTQPAPAALPNIIFKFDCCAISTPRSQNSHCGPLIFASVDQTQFVQYYESTGILAFLRVFHDAVFFVTNTCRLALERRVCARARARVCVCVRGGEKERKIM